MPCRRPRNHIVCNIMDRQTSRDMAMPLRIPFFSSEELHGAVPMLFVAYTRCIDPTMAEPRLLRNPRGRLHRPIHQREEGTHHGVLIHPDHRTTLSLATRSGTVLAHLAPPAAQSPSTRRRLVPTFNQEHQGPRRTKPLRSDISARL